ncbi:hypothetical protein QP028_10110 [Corynebacterium suedekumii]|nr:hypothetical protein QP028_10110 [Corynebacterium suedekumii]
MTVTMIDSAARMRAMVSSPPEDWQDAARRLWQPMAGMYFFIPGGPDLAEVHAQNFGFGPDTAKDAILGAIDTLERADAWGRIERGLDRGLRNLGSENPTLTLPDLTVLLVVGEPTNKHFTNEIRGLSAFGGISGYIAITIWPTDEVLDRLEAHCPARAAPQCALLARRCSVESTDGHRRRTGARRSASRTSSRWTLWASRGSHTSSARRPAPATPCCAASVRGST